MRSLALLAYLLATVPLTFVAPQVGILLWSWLSFLNPQQMAFLPTPLPLVYIVALVTVGAWFFSREPKRLPSNLTPWLIIAFMLDMTLSSAFTIAPAMVWNLWDRNMKTMILALAILFIMTNRVRLQALIWTITLSIGFFAVKGAIFTISHGGSSQVLGPPGSMIADNNTVGLAMVMVWPLMFYLRSTSADRFVRLGLSAAMAASVLAILGTYSRGAFVAFSFIVLYFWWKSKQKALFAVAGLCVIAPALLFMPAQWVDRMHSIDTYQSDSSAEGRLESWGMALRIAADRPLTGIGFDAMVTPLATSIYDPGRVKRLVAHSIWFEPLADLGIPGLAIFVTIGAVGFFQAHSIRKRTRFLPEWAWANELATMSQLSLAGYFAAGTFLSMPYYDVYYAIIAAIAILHDMVGRMTRLATVEPLDRYAIYAPRPTQPTAFAQLGHSDQKRAQQ